MKRLALAIAALAALAVPAAANPNCARDYKSFWDSFTSGPAKGMTAEQIAIVNRQALRAHDACSAGDESNAKSIFDKLRDAQPAKGDDFWKQLQQNQPAKK